MCQCFSKPSFIINFCDYVGIKQETGCIAQSVSCLYLNCNRDRKQNDKNMIVNLRKTVLEYICEKDGSPSGKPSLCYLITGWDYNTALQLAGAGLGSDNLDFLLLAFFDVLRDKTLDLSGGGCVVGCTRRAERFQHVRLEVQREAHIILAQVFLSEIRI